MASLPEPARVVIDGAINFVYSLQPLADPTVVLVPTFVKTQVSGVADMIGMDFETVSYVLGLFACYPLGMIMAQMPYGKTRHFFSFFLGAFLLQLTLGVQWIHHLVTVLVAYGMILILPRNTLKFALPVFVMVYMTLGHLHRQYINYLGWDMDFTGPQMVLTQKLYMIGYNLYDGELLAKGTDNRAAKKCSKFALKENPGLLEFLGYTFSFSSLLAGPATEYATYLGAIEGTIFNKPDGKRGNIPSNIVPTLKPFILSLVCLGIHLTLSGMFPLLDPEDPQKATPIIISKAFLENPWYYRYFYCWVGLLGIRFKYYFGWNNAEGALNVWYAGFDGVDEKGEPKGWDGANNIDILGFELAPDIQQMSRNWNKKTSNWLTRYVYMRTGGNLMAVYGLSAFWHGFYPGYYMFFLSMPLATSCDRLAKKKLSPYFSKSRLSLYGIVSSLATTITVNYLILSFTMLDRSWSWGVWKSFYFFGHIGALIFYGILTVMPSKEKKDKKE